MIWPITYNTDEAIVDQWPRVDLPAGSVDNRAVDFLQKIFDHMEAHSPDTTLYYKWSIDQAWNFVLTIYAETIDVCLQLKLQFG